MIATARSAQETYNLGAEAAKKIKNLPCLILLRGPLGIGKTEWARGFIHKYLNPSIVVTSPSYSIVNAYKLRSKSVFHVDLYRLKSIDDLESVGFWDFLSEKSVVLVEWGDQLPHEWPENIDVISVQLDWSRDLKSRKIEINPLVYSD